ncbi:unnamed protein product [Hymenolepis diminuta]|uniref:Uncharacterized protein n=1 Tax=Hymenolepis diminuta TaxID=6216 RepID=A0A564YGA6_HYMDI|nr:unnamed protein product [Hymenolepis diminuta]
MIKSTKCIGMCNHIRFKPKLVFHPNGWALVDDKRNEPEEIDLAKPHGTVLKVVVQNAGEAKQTAAHHLCALEMRLFGFTLIPALLDPFEEPLTLSL